MIVAHSLVDPTYPADLLPLMQTLLSTLADIDFAHECGMKRLQDSAMDEALKARKAAQLEAEHRLRREPWARQLAFLAEMSPLGQQTRAKAA